MTLRNYSIGYGLSILLTLIAFGLVWQHVSLGHEWPPHDVLYPIVVALALLQLGVQLRFFLHVGRKQEGWNLFALALAAIIVGILIGGTLWIMSNLSQLGHAHGTQEHEHQEPFSGPPSPQTELD